LFIEFSPYLVLVLLFAGPSVTLALAAGIIKHLKEICYILLLNSREIIRE